MSGPSKVDEISLSDRNRMVAGCNTGVAMQNLPSKDIRKHLFQTVLRHLEIWGERGPLSVSQ
jgi:hypothetical protein